MRPPLRVEARGIYRTVTIVSDHHSLDLLSHSPEQTRLLGETLAPSLRAGDVVALIGELGAGKTCFVQGLARGLGIAGPVRSPSFTLINEYPLPGRRGKFFHVDLYRLEDPLNEALTFGLDDYLLSGEGICVIEWAEKAEAILPADHLQVTLRFIDDFKRGLLVQALGRRSQAILDAYRAAVLHP